MRNRLIGDRAFYRHFFSVALPIIIQMAISSFVQLLDNIMVGQVGTLQMSGVSIANQVAMFFYCTHFGMLSGAGIFTAQFFGAGDHEGIRYTFRLKLLGGGLLFALAAVGYGVFGDDLIGFYLKGEGDPAAAAETMACGLSYLRINLVGLLPYIVSMAYSYTLREAGQTTVPMVAGISAVVTNTCLNYVLIFGHFGAPALGVNGAAVATVIARCVELAVVAGWTHLHAGRNPFIQGAYRSAYIPGSLIRDIVAKGTPLMANETVWSIGYVLLNQSYSLRGLEVVPAINIAGTIYNIMCVVFQSMGNSTGIIMGQVLGRGASREEVKDYNRKLIFATVCTSFGFAGLTAATSGFFPMLYNVTDSVRSLAGSLIVIGAASMPFNAMIACLYFTLRAGGKTMTNFIMDSVYIWAITVPLAFVLSRYTQIPIIPLYFICQFADLGKVIPGFWMLKKGTWIQNLARKDA